MKKNYWLGGLATVLVVSLLSCTQEVKLSEKIVTLQPSAAEGKDASIRSTDQLPYGDYPNLMAYAWTLQGQTNVIRFLIEFDLSDIPANAIVEEAKLSLYASTNLSEQHSTWSGSNQATIQRITTTWDEASVTWLTQPQTSADYQVALPASTAADQDYIDIDVRSLIQYMVMSPDNSHGLMVKLDDETPFRGLSFASSDHDDATRHPKLVIKYLY